MYIILLQNLEIASCDRLCKNFNLLFQSSVNGVFVSLR
jgi:hypothetical protein